ncbi:MAG: 4'-phosphopantetheinyl transferase superfamily protein [Dissulfuribacterales bacterium]
MSHIGNDIVDLKTLEAMGKAADTRFVQRVLNPDEQQAVLNSDHPDGFLWAFWAAKETAYKATSKSHPDVTSAPRRYQVILDSKKKTNPLTGEVITPHGIVPIKITFHEDYVHCIGMAGRFQDLKTGDLDDIVFGLEETNPGEEAGSDSLSERESIMVRTVAKERIASHLGRNPDEIHIMRNKSPEKHGPPMVYFKGRKNNVDISLSHDGRFVAYAFMVVEEQVEGLLKKDEHRTSNVQHRI